jgi:hypothetical protein
VGGLADGGRAVLRLADDSGVRIELEFESFLFGQVEQNGVFVLGTDRLRFNEGSLHLKVKKKSYFCGANERISASY